MWQLSGWISQLSSSTNQISAVAVSAGNSGGEEATKKVSSISGVPCVGAPGATSTFVVKLAKTEDLEGKRRLQSQDASKNFHLDEQLLLIYLIRTQSYFPLAAFMVAHAFSPRRMQCKRIGCTYFFPFSTSSGFTNVHLCLPVSSSSTCRGEGCVPLTPLHPHLQCAEDPPSTPLPPVRW